MPTQKTIELVERIGARHAEAEHNRNQPVSDAWGAIFQSIASVHSDEAERQAIEFAYLDGYIARANALRSA